MNLASLSVAALRVPIWRERRVAREGLDLYRDRSELGRGLPRGDGRPVLLIPGYLSSDASLAPLAGWLRHLGYAPHHAGITVNVDCATRTTDRLAGRLRAIARERGDRVMIVGHSLGGVLGRLLAMRHPELVRGVVCLGSPLAGINAVHPVVRAHVRLVGTLGTAGIRGLLSHSCLSGGCCAASRRLLGAPLHAGVELVSVYSRSDGIVDWRACLAPGATHVEVESSHLGMPVNPAVYRVIAERLAGLREHAAVAPVAEAA